MKSVFLILLHFAFVLPVYNITAAAYTANKRVSDADSAVRKAKPKLVFPTPNVPRLFYVQRDPNTNTIIYELNVDNKGQLDTDEPVHVYWIKYNERSQKEELNFIQRKFAYGLNVRHTGNDKYDIRFVSYKKYPLTLMKSAMDNKYHVFATIDKKEVILNRIFLRIEGGTFWFPNVVYIEVRGTDPASGKELTERFKP